MTASYYRDSGLVQYLFCELRSVQELDRLSL
jgi:hypothetical protein